MAWRMLIVADPSFMAFDLGAGSGRALLGRLEDGRLRLRDVARFPNGMLSIHGSLYWNVYRLFEEMKNSLKATSYNMAGRSAFTQPYRMSPTPRPWP